MSSIDDVTASAELLHHHLIMIHGAWAGSWVWDAVKPLLQTKGYRVHCLDLPGNRGEVAPETINLDVYCKYVRAYIEEILANDENRKDIKITLVAHSGAGVVALQVAENMCNCQGLHSLVIVAGMLLPSGMTYPEFRQTLQDKDPDNPLLTEPLELIFGDDGLTSTVTEDSAMTYFFQDLEPSVGRQAAQRLVAQPTGGLAIAANYSHNGGATRIPKLYIEATRDASVRLPVQRAMQRTVPNVRRVVSMDTGHVPHVAQPHEFCRHVCDFLQGKEEK